MSIATGNLKTHKTLENTDNKSRILQCNQGTEWINVIIITEECVGSIQNVTIFSENREKGNGWKWKSRSSAIDRADPTGNKQVAYRSINTRKYFIKPHA